MKLVVIEGLGKKETIQKYLGKDYEVLATKGHIRDLPVKTLAIDFQNNFAPKYELMPDKKDIIKNLKNKAAKADEILLATDPDREGEAISWHVANILDLDCNKNIRIEFNEISKTAVQNALKNPRPINQNLVDAQQARRVLDRIVGYKISPIISKKIKPKLSAGRVQSVALKLVVDREREIENFKPEEYWTITAILEKPEDKAIPFSAVLFAKNGAKYKVGSEQEKDEVLKNIENADFIVSNVKKSVTKTHAPAPYITSTLQQDALNKLGMSLKKTSAASQNLYEGVEIEGEGKIALITYIRTDSVRVSPEAQAMAKQFIIENYGEKYLPEKPNIYKSKKSAQDAHEAIRPINLNIKPSDVKNSLSQDNYKLYKLIYERFLASQMSDATYNSVAIEIDANNYSFKATGRTLLFAGYTQVYQDFVSKDNEKDEHPDQELLPDLNKDDKLKKDDIKAEQKFTRPPSRYTEASLVKVMEEKGIGRPATYTPTITLIESRGYTEKDGKQIKPTQLGCIVCDTLVKYFSDIMNVKFTAEMENNLDEVADGEKVWQNVVSDFYNELKPKLEAASGDPDRVDMPVEVSDVKCDKCGAFMVVRHGKFGKFLACPNYPECKNIKNIDVVVGTCPKCGKNILERHSKTGKVFYGCSGYPECNFTCWDKPTEEKCPHCGGMMLKKVGQTNIKFYCQNCNYTKYAPKEENNSEEQTEEVKE